MPTPTTSVAPEPIRCDESQCRLCSLPVRQSAIANDSGYVFCCNGCKNVWRILEDSGQLAAPNSDPRQSLLYRQALELGLIGRGENSAQRSNDAEITPPDDRGTIHDTRQCILYIDGMWCASCAWLIAEVLRRQRGVVSADVSFASDTARVSYKPARTGLEELRAAIGRLGYQTADSVRTDGDGSDSRAKSRRSELIRAGVALFFAMNVMMLAPVIYAGHASGLAPLIARVVPLMLLGLSIPVFVCAWPLFDRAIRAARHGAATMETLVTVGATTALIYSLWEIAHGSTKSYFDTADMLLGLVLGGKYIESNIRADASDAVALLRGMMPKKANVLRDRREVPVASGQLAEGDVIRTRAGETIAADGVVERGDGSVDESLLTGESRPIRKQEGSVVTGGSTLQDGALDICVTRPVAVGTLTKMVELVRDTMHKKARSEQLADQISRFFVPVVIILAIATAILVRTVLHGTLDMALSRAVAVLVIACPCALGIATPMAILAGVAAAAHRGILIGDPDSLERMTKLRRIVFDKTGTLTEGVFRVQHVLPHDADLSNLAALEKYSEHPIARAIRDYAGEGCADSDIEVEDFTRFDGSGVTGTIGGAMLFAGNLRMVEGSGASLNGEMAAQARLWAESGMTVIYYGRAQGDVRAVVALGDRLRDGVAEAISELKLAGVEPEIVSGDSSETVASIAGQAGIATWRAGTLPSEKCEIVAMRESIDGAVAMVGDGVNDAPALARADVGIAMMSGTDIAGKAAAVTFMSGRLNRLVDLIAISTETGKTIRQNLFWACAYNLFCIPLAMAGLIAPIWAAIAMLVSSITVLFNTKRLASRLSRLR